MRSGHYAIFLILISGVLGGCTNLGLRTIDPINIKYGTALSVQITEAAKRQTEYGSMANGLAKRQEEDAWFKLGTGTALAGVAIFDGNTYFLRGLALLGGTNLAVDSAFNPNSQAETYEAGYQAITCMIDKAQIVKDSENAPALSSFKQTLTTLSTNAEPADRHAVANTVSKLNNLLNSRAAILASPPDDALSDAFTKNLRSLDHAVRTKVRKTLRSPDYTALRDDLIKRAAEAEKRREEGQEAAAEGAAILREQQATQSEIAGFKRIVAAAVARSNFDADLKTCIAGAGL